MLLKLKTEIPHFPYEPEANKEKAKLSDKILRILNPNKKIPKSSFASGLRLQGQTSTSEIFKEDVTPKNATLIRTYLNKNVTDTRTGEIQKDSKKEETLHNNVTFVLPHETANIQEMQTTNFSVPNFEITGEIPREKKHLNFIQQS